MAKKSMVNREMHRKYPNRVRNRCQICGRPRGYMRRFKLCRICFRKEALQGDDPEAKAIKSDADGERGEIGRNVMVSF